MFLIIFCLHRRLISDLHISLCISLNQLQDTSTNAHFVQVSWSKLAASCWPHWLNSLNPRAILFHKLCTKTRLEQALAHRWQLTGMFSFSAMPLPTTAATSPSPSPSILIPISSALSCLSLHLFFISLSKYLVPTRAAGRLRPSASP